MKRAVIIDIDGTLASIRWRLDPYLDGGSKKEFYGGQSRDAPIPEIVALTHLAHDAGLVVIICTARSASHTRGTAEWLDQHDIYYDTLIHAPNNDPRTDDEYKRQVYLDDIAPDYDVVLVVDDRPHVVEMWRSLGLTVLAVTDPYLPPMEYG